MEVCQPDKSEFLTHTCIHHSHTLIRDRYHGQPYVFCVVCASHGCLVRRSTYQMDIAVFDECRFVFQIHVSEIRSYIHLIRLYSMKKTCMSPRFEYIRTGYILKPSTTCYDEQDTSAAWLPPSPCGMLWREALQLVHHSRTKCGNRIYPVRIYSNLRDMHVFFIEYSRIR